MFLDSTAGMEKNFKPGEGRSKKGISFFVGDFWRGRWYTEFNQAGERRRNQQTETGAHQTGNLNMTEKRGSTDDGLYQGHYL